MLKKEVLDHIHKYVHPFRITNGQSFHLKDIDPADTCGIKLDKGEAAELLARHAISRGSAGDALRAGSVVQFLVFQAMDAAGKDRAIKHVMSE